MIHQEITEFIKAEKVATVCCVDGDAPYCFNCYYSFVEQEGLLIYKSSLGTRHEALLEKNNKVAGTIIPEHVELATIKGIQFQGVLLKDSLELSVKAASSYYLAFPFALAIPGKLYALELHSIKFTDNTKGFGYKNQWEHTR